MELRLRDSDLGLGMIRVYNLAWAIVSATEINRAYGPTNINTTLTNMRIHE